jgi:hypothetical protein
MSEQVDQKQRVLKIIVIVLGILILISLGVIVAGIAMNAAKLGKAKPLDAAAPAPAVSRMAGEMDIPIPPGARVIEVTGDGKELRVLLETPEGQALLLLDRKTGAVLGTLRFVPSAP